MNNENNSKAAEVFVYRLSFSRNEPAVWLGHLDMMRTFERALRRAKIPLAWSQGYNPRPQMVFALPISVGLAAELDLIDINCEQPVDENDFIDRLNNKLPAGLKAKICKQIIPERRSLMSLVSEAVYMFEAENVGAAAAEVLTGNGPLITEKTRKGKTSDLDIRPLILDWKSVNSEKIEVRVKAGSSSNLRPDLLLKLLVEQGELNQMAAANAMITRLELILSE